MAIKARAGCRCNATDWLVGGQSSPALRTRDNGIKRIVDRLKAARSYSRPMIEDGGMERDR